MSEALNITSTLIRASRGSGEGGAVGWEIQLIVIGDRQPACGKIEPRLKYKCNSKRRYSVHIYII